MNDPGGDTQEDTRDLEDRLDLLADAFLAYAGQMIGDEAADIEADLVRAKFGKRRARRVRDELDRRSQRPLEEARDG